MSQRLLRTAARRASRAVRVRAQVRGTSERPRLHVFRSSRHIYAQVIDDSVGKTIASASTKEKGLSKASLKGTKQEQAKQVGARLAERALAHKVKAVCFDRGYFKYHGRIRALADAAREGGLDF